MEYDLLMAAASGLAIGNSLFFGAYLWFLESGNRLPNRLLALVLLALAVRISKSVIIIAFPYSSEIFPAIGLVGMAAIGPLLYLYLQSIHIEEFTLSARHASHFIPSILIAGLLPMPFITEAIIFRFYQFVVAQIFVYLLLGLQLHVTRAETSGTLKNRWGYILLSGAFVIWLAFFFQLIIDTLLLYVIATTVAAFVLYGVSFWVMRHQLAFRKSGRLEKYNGNADRLYQKILAALESEKVYRNPDLTVDQLAEKLNAQSYVLSLVINEKFGQSFPELINSYRVKEAQQILGSEQARHLSIEAVAYESGFNSISSFYSSFKKICRTTPAEYRKQVTG
ncbi:MAG: helix-turn-helix transcriptional regulator [Balneolaceae bacterium]|nr:helix-turn-helix transcriptional regulator [Balneolaceae bacterium]